MNKSKIGIFSIIILLLLSLSISLAAAQYSTEKTTDISIGSNGLFIASETSVGIMYTVEGTPGATGTVTASVYNGNPQATANIPSGISLSHFVVITFDMSPIEFYQAKITISYSDSDVASMNQPYAVYKYVSSSDSYVVLSTDVDATAKTMTTTLNSVDDPLLAIGGTEISQSSTIPMFSWIVVAISVVIIAFLAVFLVFRSRRM
jgi:hypothetical protein